MEKIRKKSIGAEACTKNENVKNTKKYIKAIQGMVKRYYAFFPEGKKRDTRRYKNT